MGLDFYYSEQDSRNKKRRRAARNSGGGLLGMRSSAKSRVWQRPQVITAEKEEGEHRETAVDFRRLSWVIVVGLILLAAWWLFLSPAFAIADIVYSSDPPGPLIQERIASLKGRNILLLQPGNLAQEWQEEQPSIKSLRFYRGLPRTLRVEVEERSGALIWRSQDKSYLIDASGVVFEESSDAAGFAIIDDSNLPIALGQKIVTDDVIKSVQTIIDQAPAVLAGEKISEVHIGQSIFNLTAVTDKGVKILFDIIQPLDLQLEALGKVYAEHRGEIREYVDVRVLGKAYIK